MSTLFIGNDILYNKNVKRKIKNLDSIINDLKLILKKYKIHYIQPIYKNNLNIDYSLWVRDIIFNFDNVLYHSNTMKCNNNRCLYIKEETKTIPFEYEIIPEKYNIDGGDIIQYKNIVFVGVGARTDRQNFTFIPYKKIFLKHNALHLDCCFMILPCGTIFYTKQIQIPKQVKKDYNCISLEKYVHPYFTTNLATNILVLNNKTLIVAKKKQFNTFYNLLKKIGYTIHEIDVYNLFEFGGSIRCMTQWIHVDNKLIVR